MSARPIPPATRERLAKLVPRFASTFESERTATLAAIQRTLRAEGLDWHDLTAAIQQASVQQRPPPSRGDYPPSQYDFGHARWLVEQCDTIECRGCGML